MEQHNAEVVCPSCGKTQNETSPGETGKMPQNVSSAVPTAVKKRPKSTTRLRSPIKP